VSDIKVSVIVPVYNVEQYLRKCLDSLVNQTLEDIEIIVVNDGTPDNSQVIIDEYVKNYPNKVYGYIKENGGLSDARNFGMQYAKGEYIAFVDSDDFVAVTMYEKLYNKAIEENAEIVVCAYFNVNANNNTMKSAQKGNLHIYDGSIHDHPEIIENNAPYAWNKLVKKELFDRTGILFPKGYIYEDICTMYPLLASANKISKVDEELYYYIVERKGSITSSFSKSKTLMLRSLELLDERFEELGLFDEFRDQIVVINLRHIYLRFKEFDKYKWRREQIKFVNQAFNLLNKHFKNWRKNSGSYIYFTLAEDRHIKRWFYKRRLYWLFVAMMPLKWIQDYRDWDYKKRHPGSDMKRYYIKMFETKKVVKNRVIFESFHGKNISDSPFEMMKELYKRGGYEIYVTSTESSWEKNKKLLEEEGLSKVKMVQLGVEKYFEILATAKYLVNNVSFPISFTKRPEQVYINTWHGTPLKTLGKNMKKGIESMFNIQHNFLQSSYLLFPNEYTKECTMKDYNLDKLFTYKTVIEGYPRNTVFSDKEKGLEVKKKLGLEDKKVYVYMPTWRGANSYGKMGIEDITENLEKLDAALDDNHLLYVNLHPNIGEAVDYSVYKFIKPFPEGVSNYEFVNASDALITDYSSIFFDYSITRKPIVLFMYDYDEYMDEHGTYFDARTLPFKQFFDIDSLCNAVSSEEILTYKYDDANEYFEKFIKYDGPDCTRKLVDLVFKGKEDGLIVEDYAKNREREWKISVLLEIKEKKEEYDEYVNSQDIENTIFVMNKKYFHALMNKWYYEEYNDKLTYIIFGYQRMLNEEDEKIYVAKDKSNNKQLEAVKKKARERAYARSLPNIKIINKDENRRII